MIKNFKFLKKIFAHISIVVISYINTVRNFYSYSRNDNIDSGHEPIGNNLLVDVVITCCNRSDRLDRLLESFFKFNTYMHLNKFIIIEDGLDPTSEAVARKYIPNKDLVYIYNRRNMGQLKSIDIAYSHVSTNFVFHVEEDWLFIRPGFIEQSFEMFEKYSNLIYFSLRALDDQNSHPVKPYLSDYTPRAFWKLCWVGFGFNPSLRKISHYNMIKPFSRNNTREISIGLFYYLLGFRVIVSSGSPYVVHNGSDCSTSTHYRKA